MANLRWFRKHQKIMLVVFGVGLMIVFVVTAAVPYWGNSGGGPSAEEIAKINQPIVQWTGGTLTRSQLQRMLELHYSAMHFQEALVAGSTQGPIVRPIPPIPETSMEAADRAIFARFLMAQFARDKLGLVVSDNAVYDYLQALVNSKEEIPQQYFISVAKNSSSKVGYLRLHEYLKMELAAMRFEDIIGESFFISGSGAAPANVLDAWQAFLQNEKQIECAVEEFNAADFLPQIKDEPTTADLRKIYEEGKTLDVDPLGERPGFKQPRRVQIEYVTADDSAFLDLAIQDVTPEQVLAEYNRLVEIKDQLVMERIPDAEIPPVEKLDGEKLEDDPSQELKDNMGEGNDPAPTPDAGKLDPPPSQPPATEKTPPGEEPKSSNPPKKSESDKDGGPNSIGSTGDQSDGTLLRPGKYLHFVSLPRPRQEPSQTPDSQEEKKQDEPDSKPIDPAIPEAAQDPEPTAGDAAQDPAAQQPEMKQDPPPAVAAPLAANPPAKTPQDPTERAKKLDAALELAIKQRLKREEANQRLTAAVEKAHEAMNDYMLALSDYESMKNTPGAEASIPPTPLEMKQYAAEQYLKYGKTELCTYEDLAKEPVGMATEFQIDPTTNRVGTKRVADDVFVNYDRRRLFDVQEIDSMGQRYLYWLTAKEDSRIPSFESARNDVISFWKKQKSIEMAKSAAEKVKVELSANGKLLVDEHKTQAKLTGDFRWFQPSFNQINYGAPKGVRNAGEEFMAVAFGLKKPNEVGVALNDDRTAAYVIQLISGDPRSDEQLRDQFLDHIATVRQVIPSATNTFYNRKAVDKLVDSLNKELKVEWIGY